MRLVILLMSFLVIVGCSPTEHHGAVQIEPTAKRREMISGLKEIARKEREARDAEERAKKQAEMERERKEEEERAKLVKQYELETRPLKELIPLAYQAARGSEIQKILNEVIERRVPDYLTSLSLEELKAIGAGEVECPAGRQPYLGYHSAHTTEWIKMVEKHEGGYDYLIDLYLHSDSRQLVAEVEKIEKERATKSSLEQNLSDLQKFAQQSKEGPRDGERVNILARIHDQVLRQQILNLPEQEPTLMWKYLKSLKEIGVTDSESYSEIKGILAANLTSLEEAVEISNY